MTALELVNAVLKRLRQDTISDFANLSYYEKDILAKLNDVQSELWHEIDWRPLKKTHSLTLSANTATYDLPSDFGRLIGRPYTNSPSYQIIEPVGDDEWQEETYGKTNSGTPYICRVFDSNANSYIPKISFYYTPDDSWNSKAVYIDYQKRLSDLSSVNDISPFPDEVMIQGAVCKIKAADGDLTPREDRDFERMRATLIVGSARERNRKVKYRDF